MTLKPKGRGLAITFVVALGGLASMVNASRAGTVSPKTMELGLTYKALAAGEM